MINQHAPTPWKSRKDNPRNVASTLPDGSTHVVAVFASADDAAYAILAANCHHEMLSLLKELIDIEGPQPGTFDWSRKVQRTIEKAEGKQR